MVILIDNYDSFSYNLFQLAGSVNPQINVIRNDAATVDEIRGMNPQAIILSPGPGRPEDAGICIDVVKTLGSEIPILGICLGHQALGEYFGGTLRNLSEVYHGVATPIEIIADDYIFEGIGSGTQVGRYHSWVVDADTLPPCLEVTAISPDGAVMAMRHRDLDVRGVQFHPESIMSADGPRMLANWLRNTL